MGRNIPSCQEVGFSNFKIIIFQLDGILGFFGIQLLHFIDEKAEAQQTEKLTLGYTAIQVRTMSDPGQLTPPPIPLMLQTYSALFISLVLVFYCVPSSELQCSLLF